MKFYHAGLKQKRYDNSYHEMSDPERIKKDIALFETSIKRLSTVSLDEKEEEVVALAKGYFEDTKYYLDKGDYFTAFGCINYAHGLLDAIRRTKEE